MKTLTKHIYQNIRNTVAEAQQKVYTTVNVVMVETYWNIGKQIFQAQGHNERAEYGKGLLKFLAEKLSEEFGKGYNPCIAIAFLLLQRYLLPVYNQLHFEICILLYSLVFFPLSQNLQTILPMLTSLYYSVFFV